MSSYSLGIDFGTLSARALLVDAASGEEVFTCEEAYAHGVLDSALPCGKPLPRGFALQLPEDYRCALKSVVRKTLAHCPGKLVGMGVDFTSSTLLCTDDALTPLCEKPEFSEEPFAYAIMWKHTAGQRYADAVNRAAADESFYFRHGGVISTELILPRVLHLLNETPALYAKTSLVLEAADWMTSLLCGRLVRSKCTMGFKGFWSEEGYPSTDFYRALHPQLADFNATRFRGEVYPVGARAGYLTAQMAAKLGLPAGLPIATGIVDGHAAVLAAGITEPGKLLIIMGTSICHMTLDKRELAVPGICGMVKDGMVPGYYGYEAGQTAGGDILDWFCANCVPARYGQAAAEAGCDLLAYMNRLAAGLFPGESGLMALDWWNGNRSTLADAELSGLIMGLTLSTRPEHIYRALTESAAFGTRAIVEAFEANGLRIHEVIACGGIAEKSDYIMQLNADVLQRPLRRCGTTQPGALGCAILGVAAAGNGCEDVAAVTRVMGKPGTRVFLPDTQRARVYDQMYAEYRLLYEHFGKENKMMHRLKALAHAGTAFEKEND